jgi:hypothetical protein
MELAEIFLANLRAVVYGRIHQRFVRGNSRFQPHEVTGVVEQARMQTDAGAEMSRSAGATRRCAP